MSRTRAVTKKQRGRAALTHSSTHSLPRASAASRLSAFSSKHVVALALSVALAHLVLAMLTFMPQPHTGGDNAAYIALGRSLLERRAYLSLFDPATPPHTQYPPVFPAILGFLQLIGIRPFAGMKIVIALMSTVAVAFTYLWIRRRRRPAMALGVAAIVVLSPGVLELTHWILSDVPFWMFTMVALWAFERMGRDLRGRFAIATAATVLAYFTRSAGLPLLLAAFAWLALRKRWKQLGVFAGVTVPLAFLWWLRAQTQGGVDYVSQFWFVNPYQPELGRIGFFDLFVRAAENAIRYVTIHTPILLTGGASRFAIVAGGLVLAFGIYGWVRRLRRPTLAELFLPLYIGLLLIWPAVWSGERFLLPALPLILYYAGDGLVRVAHLVRKGSGLKVGLPAIAVIALLMVPAQVDAVRISAHCMVEYRTGDRYACLPPVWRDWFATAEWAETALPDTATVLSRKPTLFHLIAGRRGRYYPMSDQASELIRAADEINARYVVLDQLDALSQAYLLPAISARFQAFCMMYTSPLEGTLVLGILPGAADMPDSPPSADATLPPCGPEYWSREALRRRGQ